jgi:YVTN family beta-propeller protein
LKIIRPILVIVCALSIGCQTGLPQPRPRLEDEGAVYLYLEAAGPEAGRLRVDLAGVSALDTSGGEVPLTLRLKEFRTRDLRRQRLLASGPLPPGDYAGLVFRTARASLEGDQGEAALLVPEAPGTVDFKFTVRRREGQVIALALRYAEAVGTGFRFTPAFSVRSPERPNPALLGFAANARSHDITVFNKKSRQVFDVILTGRGPTGMALDQRGRRLYVALSGEDGVEVVDVLSGKVVDRVRLAPGDAPVAVAVTPDGATLLSANRGSSTVSIIDAGSRFEVAKLRVGSGPLSITMDRAGRRAFVFNTGSNSISVIDVPGRGIIRSIPTDPGPLRGELNRAGDRLYVIHEIASYVTVINVNTLAVASRFPVRFQMDAIKLDRGTDLVYLASRREPVVGIYDPLTFGPVGFLATGAGVIAMATDSEENTLYLVTPDLDRIIVFERVAKRVVSEIDGGDGLVWVSVMGEN